MTPLPPDRGNVIPDVELVLEHEESLHLLHPDQPNPGFDALLEQRGARSWVFLPYGPEPEKKKKARRYHKRIAALREELGETKVHEGGLRRREAVEVLEPGLFVFDLQRATARELGKVVQAEEFYWGARGEAVEVHPVLVFGIDDTNEGSIETARAGLRDLGTTLLHVVRDPGALWNQIAAEIGSLFLTFVALLVAGVCACLLSWFFVDQGEKEALEGAQESVATAPDVSGATGAAGIPNTGDPAAGVKRNDEEEDDRDDEDDDDRGPRSSEQKLLSWLLHPVLLPSLLLARYLRRHYYTGSLRKPTRELTTEETLSRWREMRLHLLAVWGVAAMAVVILTAAKLYWKGQLTADDLIDDASSYLAVCVWVLTPIAFSRDMGTAISRIIEGAFAVFFTLLCMKFSLMIANWFSAFLWSLVGSLIPFEVPLWIMSIVDAVLAAGTELFFLAHLLGYVWLKERTQFALRASGEI